MDGAVLDWNEVNKGVPQGSILGPLLFVLFMNDLPDVVQECSIGVYADDIMLYASHCDPAQLSEIIEGDLNSISMWIKSNGLKMNVAKTQLMVLNRKNKNNKASAGFSGQVSIAKLIHISSIQEALSLLVSLFLLSIAC